MNQKHHKRSTHIATPYCMAAAFLITCVCIYLQFVLLAGYSFFLFLVSATSYFWGKWSVKGISVHLQGSIYHAYPGQQLEMEFTLKNDKVLPLVWLDWMQIAPPNHCLEVPEEFEVLEFEYPEKEGVLDVSARQKWMQQYVQQHPVNEGVEGAFQETLKHMEKLGTYSMISKGISFIRWHETVEWTSIFRAAHRGVYVPDRVEVYTGDGLGLSVQKKECPLATPPVFVVYPRRIEVKTDAFFRSAWSASVGSRGMIEDVTVLRGTRDYQRNDPFKRINWRMAARSDELSINLYDTISPKSVYFFVDTATFYQVSQDNAQFEETLSVVGSLISELFEADMSVGLYLPSATKDLAPMVNPENTTAADCLLALALADCNSPMARFSRESIAHLLATQSGHIYYICYDATHGRFDQLFEEAGISHFSVISHREPARTGSDAISLDEIPVSLISEYKRYDI